MSASMCVFIASRSGSTTFGASALIGPGWRRSSVWRMILFDSTISRMRTM